MSYGHPFCLGSHMIRLIREPHVFLSGSMTFHDHPEYQLPDGEATRAERLISHAAKICYDSYGPEGRPVRENVRHLIAERHGSVLEHAYACLTITGISRGLSHELVRHRAGFAYSQRSTRYTNETDAAFVLEPYYASLSDDDPLLKEFRHSCAGALTAYRAAVDDLLSRAPADLTTATARRKWARGKARQLLPHALETRLVMSGNLRAWRTMLEQRMSAGAEPEIARLGAAILDVLRPLAPVVFEDMIVELRRGVPLVSVLYSKV